MKNTFKFILSLTLLLCLNSCVSESNDNVDEFVQKLNQKTEYELDTDDFTVTKKDYYIFSTVINHNILLSLYCNDKNEIVMSTVTTNKNNTDEFNNIWRTTASCIINSEQVQTERIKVNTEFGGWCVKEIQNSTSTVILISKAENDIHNNDFAKIKEIINKKTTLYQLIYHIITQFYSKIVN